MSKTIIQKIVFKNTTPKALYELYTNAEKHTIVTGAMAKNTAKEGAKFSAYDGYITGKNLQLVKDRLIVQSWSGSDWKKEDVDSTFTLHFESKGKDTLLHVVHANLPDEHAKSIGNGWHEYYWTPWKAYLTAKSSKK